MDIRKLNGLDLEYGLDLCWHVFCECIASSFTPEGISSFYQSVTEEETKRAFDFYGAFENETLLGAIGIRRYDSHIGLFFVEIAYQKQGVGRALWEYARKLCRAKTVTVNAAPGSVAAYEHLGFVKTGEEQIKNGISYVPMAYEKENQ